MLYTTHEYFIAKDAFVVWFHLNLETSLLRVLVQGRP